MADEVIEISRVYPAGYFRCAGSYDDFILKREEFLEGQASRQESVANQVRRETEWLGRKAAARTRKASSRIEDAARRREELDDLKYRNAAAGTAALDFVATGRQSRKLLAAAGIAKSLGGRPLFSGLDLTLAPGSKLGLLGPNGSGKSTLLRVLGGELAPDTGTVTLADGLRIVRVRTGPGNARPGGHAAAGAVPQWRDGDDRRPAAARGGPRQAVPLPPRATGGAGRQPVRRRAGAGAPGPADAPAGRPPAAGRADQRSRHPGAGGAGGQPGGIRRRPGPGEPRPRVDGPALHGSRRAGRPRRVGGVRQRRAVAGRV